MYNLLSQPSFLEFPNQFAYILYGTPPADTYLGQDGHMTNLSQSDSSFLANLELDSKGRQCALDVSGLRGWWTLVLRRLPTTSRSREKNLQSEGKTKSLV